MLPTPRVERQSGSPNESPQDRLRAVIANGDALRDWTTLGGCKDVDDGAALVERAQAAAGRDDTSWHGHLDDILEAGLALRDGMFLRGPHLVVYAQLRVLGAEPARHVVCQACGLVFAPRRKRAGTRRCDRCDKSNALPPFTRRDHPDGRGYSFAGLFAGTTHVRTCECCGEEFLAGKATTLYCGGACDKAMHEGRSRRRERSPLEEEYDAAISDAIRRGVAESLQRGLPALAAARLDDEKRIGGRAVIEEAFAQARARSPRGKRPSNGH